MTPDEILHRLNAYEQARDYPPNDPRAYIEGTANNIWQDVIYPLLTGDEWDAAPDSSDRFSHDGIEYWWEPSTHQWETDGDKQ